MFMHLWEIKIYKNVQNNITEPLKCVNSISSSLFNWVLKLKLH